MAPATFVFFLLVFTVVGVVFLFIHMVMGSFLRPSVPDPEKLTIYECGEPTVGSAWIQFDLRFYVVALLFVIFDVEVAFFFPWATVFGKANQLSHSDGPVMELLDKRKPLAVKSLEAKLTDQEKEQLSKIDEQLAQIRKQQEPLLKQLEPIGVRTERKVNMKILAEEKGKLTVRPPEPGAAARWAQIAFWDIAIFFGVLMVGFAYVWRRGDIDWVRAYGHHQEPSITPEKPLEQSVPIAAPPPVAVH